MAAQTYRDTNRQPALLHLGSEISFYFILQESHRHKKQTQNNTIDFRACQEVLLQVEYAIQYIRETSGVSPNNTKGIWYLKLLVLL